MGRCNLNQKTESMLGYDVWSAGLESCLAEIGQTLLHGTSPRWLSCINPHSYVVARNDLAFENALRDADWLIPDGIGVVYASKLLRGSIRSRITGWDVFIGLHSAMEARGGGSVFFLGATDETLKIIQKRMALDFPSIRVAGTYSPPFQPSYSPAEVDAMVAAINAMHVDVLWVGMTAPKQEKWISEVLPRLNIKFAGAVGAVFDFYSGKVKRSHPAFQRLGLEWLPRLTQQPRRLWRRTFISAPIFIRDILAERRFGKLKKQ